MSDDELNRVYGAAWCATPAPDDHPAGLRAVARAARAAAFREAADVCAVVAAEAKQMDGLDGDYESGVEAGAEQCCDALRATAAARGR